MRIWTFIKIVAAIMVLAAIGVTLAIVNHMKREVLEPQHEQKELVAALATAEAPEIEPGEKAYRKAQEAVALGNYQEAREKLLYVVNFYPSSDSAAEARRILGEMNMDDVLSPEHKEGKTLHTVKRGESFIAIANAHQTTIDCIMQLNGLMEINRLQPGDELLVMPLNFRVTIEPGRGSLTLWNGGTFLKEYALVHPESAKASGVLRTKIENKGGFKDGKKVNPGSPGYRSSSKSIGLAQTTLRIEEAPDDADPSEKGIFLKPSDMEELSLILRTGNEVEIRSGTR